MSKKQARQSVKEHTLFLKITSLTLKTAFIRIYFSKGQEGYTWLKYYQCETSQSCIPV